MRKTYQTTVVNAPVSEVWNTLRNFHDMSWATGFLTQCEAVGGKSTDQTGPQRGLNGV